MTQRHRRSLPFVLAKRYRVYQLLGSGRFADVYLAHDRQLSRPCAIKLLRSDPTFDLEIQRKRLEREAHALATLVHEAIVTVFDAGIDDHDAWIVMELVDGESLEKAGTLNPVDAAQIMSTIASALTVAHQAGILHRDIKPANILMAKDGTVKLADFGIAMIARIEPGLTLVGTPIGTPGFMSPEQAEGRIDRLSDASDVYSMGATLYALLTGRPPFPTGDDHSVETTLKEVIVGKVVSPRTLNADIPEDLEAICLKCLAHRPQDRLQSAVEVQHALERFLDGQPVRFARRTSLKWMVTAGVTGFGAVTSGVIWQQQNHRPPNQNADARDGLADAGSPERPQTDVSENTDTAIVTRTPLPDGPPGLVATLLGHSEPLSSLAFSSDGRTVASSGHDMTVRFWDVVSQSELRQCHANDSKWISDVVFSRDGMYLVTGRSFGTPPKVRLVNVASGAPTREFIGHDKQELVLCVDISSDSRWVAAMSVDSSDNHVVARVWDRLNGNTAFEIDCSHEQAMVALRFLPDNSGLLISTLSKDFGTRLFDLESQTEVRAYRDSHNNSREIAIASDGSFFCVRVDGRLAFFKTHELQSFRSFRFGWTTRFLLTPDDRHLIWGSGQKLSILKIDSQRIVFEQESETVRFELIALSPDGRFLVSGGGKTWSSEKNTFIGDGDYAVYLWRLPAEVWPQAPAASTESST